MKICPKSAVNGIPLTLAQVPQGARAKVIGYCCDNALRGRLCALGITPGCELDVCQACDQVRLRVKDCNLVLGGNMASGILCEPVMQSAEDPSGS